ncbi:MAG TPA: PilN domain-containing protein [Burkholderiaceae bacterium]|nr:PilN domain-containing protein [Burkholderiaceae bacterium]HPW07465.1 PilN domain-containing protein [Burkholderiaceae bacterium]
MILINLLPHREAARKRRRDVFNISLGTSALVGGLIAGGIFLWYQAQISSQQGKNQMLTSEIKKLEVQIKDIASLEAEIAGLRARQQAVEDLQADRNIPVHLLTELVKQLPDGVYISSMKQENQLVTLGGVAQSNERVSELLRNLANNTPWFAKPELIEIVAGSEALSPREQRRVANFKIRVRLMRASEAEKAAQAAIGGAAAVVPVAAAAASAPVKK